MPRRKTQQEFIKEINNITNNSYVVLSNYVNNRTKVIFKHLECNSIFSTIPKDFLSGKSRCKYCGALKIKSMNLKTQEKFEVEFENRAKNEYKLLSQYSGVNLKIKVLHIPCNTIFDVLPSNFIHKKSRCPICYGNKRKSTKDFKNEVFEITKGEYECLSDYVNNRTKVVLLHKECGDTFDISPTKFLSGQRCPKCSLSKGEERIKEVLKNLNIDFALQYRFKDCRGDKYPLPFDFAIFYQNKLYCLIEYDGEQHFKPVNFNGISDEKALELFNKTKTRDEIKNSYCKTNKISLIRINYNDYNKIEDIIVNMAIPSQARKETT